MKKIDAYLAKTVLGGIGLVSLMLCGLQVFILLVNQIDDLGRGQYNLVGALKFVCLSLPYEVYTFFPMACLLGCLIGLGVLASHRELVVIRASGVAIYDVMGVITKAGIGLILIVTLFGETVAPKLAYLANTSKLQAISGGQSLRTAEGMWLRHQDDFIYIEAFAENNTLLNVMQFHFDDKHALRFARLIPKVTITDGKGVMHDYQQTNFNAQSTSVEHQSIAPWDIAIDASIFEVSHLSPDELPLISLWNYVHAMKVNHQAVSNIELSFWQRLLQPLTTWVMLLLAVPFIFGPLRSSTMGAKLLLGALVGFGFHLLNRFMGPLTTVYQLPPLLVAFGPTLIFALLGMSLMRRAR